MEIFINTKRNIHYFHTFHKKLNIHIYAQDSQFTSHPMGTCSQYTENSPDKSSALTTSISVLHPI